MKIDARATLLSMRRKEWLELPETVSAYRSLKETASRLKAKGLGVWTVDSTSCVGKIIVKREN